MATFKNLEIGSTVYGFTAVSDIAKYNSSSVIDKVFVISEYTLTNIELLENGLANITLNNAETFRIIADAHTVNYKKFAEDFIIATTKQYAEDALYAAKRNIIKEAVKLHKQLLQYTHSKSSVINDIVKEELAKFR